MEYLGVYDWFETTFPCYKIIFKLYFNNAERIIAIKETTKEENEKKYGINNDKYKILKNSINFDTLKIKNDKTPKKIKKFLIISRLEEEKKTSILNSILLFKKYYATNKKAQLTIVGNGNLMQLIIDETKDIESVTKILGERNDILPIISENDIIVALDRCILEAIAMRKLALISGYDQIKELVTPKNIKIASNENFSGVGLQNRSIEELVDEIKRINKNDIQNIVNENYKYAYDNLNINKNIYFITNPENIKIEMDAKKTMESIIELQNMYVSEEQYANKIYKESKEMQKWMETQIENRDKEIEELKNSIN